MNLFRTARAKLCALFRKEQLDAEMTEEMRAHIDLQTQENLQAGMYPEEAGRAALRDFGWMESLKETCRDHRGTLWIESLWRDLCYSARMLSKSPGFMTVAVLTLALGIGANLALFTLLDDEFLRPRPVPRPDQLWAIVPADSTGRPKFFNFSTPYYDAIRKNNHVFEQIMDMFRVNAKHRTADGLEEVFGNIVSANYFDFIGTRPLLGRGFLPEEDLDGASRVVI